MELKAVNEYKTPEYSTSDESKNKVFRFIMNCKKVSVGVLAMLLICNKTAAVTELAVTELAGTVLEGPGPFPTLVRGIVAMFQLISYLISAILIVYTGIIFVKNIKQENADKKQKIKKRGIICIIVAILLPILSILIANVSDIIINNYITKM